MTTPVRVLIVDDSPTMRGLISSILLKDKEIEVVGEAGDPYEAREAIKALSPDVVTLDVEMPRMSGLDFLDRIMRLRPTPVIMVSSLTHRGADESIRALEAGAVDCVAKPVPGRAGGLDQLPAKVKAAARAKLWRHQSPVPQAPAAMPSTYQPGRRLVMIGSSTGGVEALSAVLGGLPANCPPVVVAQHMPESFLSNLAQRLDNRFAPRIAIATHGAPLVPGHVYLAPGGNQHLEVSDTRPWTCVVREGAPVNGYCPSVERLFRSGVTAEPKRIVAVMLTGMGRDGADAMLALRQAGATTFGQDEATSLIYGMPKAAFELGAVERQLPLGRMATAILETTNQENSGKN